MFFNSAKKVKQEGDRRVIETMISQKTEIKKKLEEMDQVNRQLHAAVAETQVISLGVMTKLRNELKVAKKSITSICRKLKDGAILVNHLGEVMLVNGAAEKLLEISEASYIKKQLGELINSMSPVRGSENLHFSPGFFEDLSLRIINKLHCLDCGDCTVSDRIKSQLPAFLDIDNDVTTEVELRTNRKQLLLNFTFSILDNDPESINDLTYIFLFRSVKKPAVRRTAAV